MKSFILPFLFTLYSLTFTSLTHANETFIKYKDNPLKISMNGIYATVLQSSIKIKDGKLYGLFSVSSNGTYKIVQASSTDGISWEYINTTRASSQNLYAPKLVNINNETGIIFTKDDDKLKIYYAKCKPDIVCDEKEIQLLEPNTNGWDSIHVAGGEIIQNKEIYYLLYEGFSGNWNIGLAYSKDGVHWERCSSNPIFSDGGGVYAHVDGDMVTAYFHSSNGVESISTNNISCASIWADRKQVLLKDQPYDFDQIISPSIVTFNNRTFIFYTGRGTSSAWTFNLASFPEYVPPKLSTKIPIFFIPGMFTSWNKDAILHNTTVTIDKWKLATFIKEYDGIINTFHKYGYKDNDFIVVPYDWRKNLNTTVNEIGEYIKTKRTELASEKIYIIGHSLGGLIGRIITQTNSTSITKMISVAGPQKGVIQAYKPTLTGEIDRDDSLMWLASKVILQLNSNYSDSKAENLNRYMPITINLIPTYDFLINSKGEIVQPIKPNLYLKGINSSFSYSPDKYVFIYGEKDNFSTPEYYRVNQLNKINSFVLDNTFFKTVKGYGDYLVPSISSNPFNTGAKLNLDHSEVIYSTDGIKQILREINMPIIENNIVSGSKTKIAESIFFFIQSPASFKVMDPDNKTFVETDGYVHISYPTKGKYKVEINGLTNGVYTLHIAQLGKKSERWDKLSSKISQGQSQTYELKIDPQNPIPPFSKQHYKKQLCEHFLQKEELIYKAVAHICKNIHRYPSKDVNDLLDYLSLKPNLAEKINLVKQYLRNYYYAEN